MNWIRGNAEGARLAGRLALQCLFSETRAMLRWRARLCASGELEADLEGEPPCEP